LPTRQFPRFTVSQLVSGVRKMLADTQTQVDLDLALTTEREMPAFPRFWSRSKSPPTIGLSVGGVTVAVTGHDRPAFDAEDLGRLDVDMWQGGRSQIARCCGHVEVGEVRVTASQETKSGYERAAAVTLVAAAVSHLVDTIGVVWHASLVSLPKDCLPGIVENLAVGQAPAALWLGAGPLADRDGETAGLVTRGLHALLGAEIGISEAKLPHSVALEIVMGLAGRIVGSGSLPSQDTRLNFGAGRSYRVRQLPRGGENGILKMLLVPESGRSVAGAA
jgi:hypothetical protein